MAGGTERTGLAVRVIRLGTIDSTSLLARREVERAAAAEPGSVQADDPVVYVAREQTGGVGQQGRRWWSPKGGAWFTLVVRVPRRPDPTLALRVGAIVAARVREELARAGVADAGKRVTVKPPNDVLIDGRKVAGILIEVLPVALAAAGRGRAGFAVLVGVGVNVANRSADAPAELRGLVTSLAEQVPEAGMPEPGAFANDLAGRILAALDWAREADDDAGQ